MFSLPVDKLEHPPVANGPPTDPYSTVMIVSGLVTIASSLLLIGNAINFKAHEPLTTAAAADDEDANAKEVLSANSVNSSPVSLSLAVPVKGTLPPAAAPSGLLRMEDASKPEPGKDTVTKGNDK